MSARFRKERLAKVLEAFAAAGQPVRKIVAPDGETLWPKQLLAISMVGSREKCALPVSTILPTPAESKRRVRNKAQRNAWFKRRARSDPAFVLNRRVAKAVRKALDGDKAGRSWESLVGYSLADLQTHFEKQFVDGMSWDNIGAWHIDHRRPLSSFQIAGPDCPDFKSAWALSNLQPLWRLDNLRKGAKWERPL